MRDEDRDIVHREQDGICGWSLRYCPQIIKNGVRWYRKERKLRRPEKSLITLIKEEKATLVPRTARLLYQQTKGYGLKYVHRKETETERERER